MRQLTMSLISGLVGALIAVAFQSYLGYTFDELATKRDVLRRFAGRQFRTLNQIRGCFGGVPDAVSDPRVAGDVALRRAAAPASCPS